VGHNKIEQSYLDLNKTNQEEILKVIKMNPFLRRYIQRGSGVAVELSKSSVELTFKQNNQSIRVVNFNEKGKITSSE
jgi:hypothetical protein